MARGKDDRKTDQVDDNYATRKLSGFRHPKAQSDSHINANNHTLKKKKLELFKATPRSHLMMSVEGLADDVFAFFGA